MATDPTCSKYHKTQITLQETLDMVKTILPRHSAYLSGILTSLEKRIHILDDTEGSSTMQHLVEQRDIYIMLLVKTMRAINLLTVVIQAGHDVVLSIAEDLSQFSEPPSSLAANLLFAFKELCSGHEDYYTSLLAKFDEMISNDPFINENNILQDIQGIIHSNGINDTMDGITDGYQESTNTEESKIIRVGYNSKTPDGAFSEFTPYRDSYDLDQPSEAHCDCLVNLIVSNFYPPRDSFDLTSQPSFEFHDVPYQFSNEYIPHRNSFDLKRGSSDHQVVLFRHCMKFIPYQDSYDELSLIASE